MTEILNSASSNFFSIGSLIATIFNFFVVLFFATIKKKNKATISLMMLYMFLGMQNLGYLISSSFYHPLTAYHRWLTVLSVLPGIIFMVRFFFYFPVPKNIRTGNIIFAVQWIITIAVDIYFIYVTLHSGKDFHFSVHYWDFSADAASLHVAMVINLFILTALGAGVWRIITSPPGERIKAALMLFSFVIITVVPGIFNAASRAGIFDRGTFQIVWNIVTVLGFFTAISIYINLTTDKTTLLAKIVGMSLVTFLLMLQGLSYYIMRDVEKSYDDIHRLKLARHIDNPRYFPDDIKFIFAHPLAGGRTAEVLTDLSSEISGIDSIDVQNSLMLKKIKESPALSKDAVEKILDTSHGEFAAYANYIRKRIKSDQGLLQKEGALAADIKKTAARVQYHADKISQLPGESFAVQYKKYIAGIKNIYLKEDFFSSPVLSSQTIIKSDAMKYIRPLHDSSERNYLKSSSGEINYIVFYHLDEFRNVLYEAGYSYKAYREFIHPSALRIEIIIIISVSVILLIFPLYLLGTIMKPLYALVTGMKRVNQGEFNFNIPVLVTDETGYLTARFNKMLSYMNESTLEIDRIRSFLKNIIDSIHSILISIDSRLIVTQWNLSAEISTGIKAADIVGLPLDSTLPMLNPYIGIIEAAVSDYSPKKIEKALYVSDGKSSYYEIAIYPLHNKQLQGAVIRIDDITQNVRLEDAMIQSEKMMSVGGLAAGMAHEINNPLGGILMAAQNITRRISPDLKKNIETAANCGITMDQLNSYLNEREITHMISDVREMGERASKIVANMLSFSRKSSSQMLKADIADVLNQTIDLAASDYDLKKKYDFRHINIIKNFQPDIPEVECVPIEIQQVILNLLKNAAQAMHRDTERKFNPEISISLSAYHDIVMIEVSDNGPGMPEDVRKRIFEPFFTTKEVGIGTGLGLSVSYFIITNKHKGTLDVKSAPGRGTTFIIGLPVKHQDTDNA